MNRHYSAAQGRFTQVDPIEMDAVSLVNPQSLNLYAYCFNDPINHIDPDGLLVEAGAGGAIGGVVGAIIGAVIGALRVIFGSRGPRTRMGARLEQRLAPVETGSSGGWEEPTVESGVGAVAIQAKKQRPKVKPAKKKTDAEIKREKEAAIKTDEYDASKIPEQAAALAALAAVVYFQIENILHAENQSGADERVIKCQIAQESNFNINAKGGLGEIGLLQMFPEIGAKFGYAANALWNPAINIRVGTSYLKYLIGRFGSVRAGLVAYNGGEGNVAILGQDAKLLANARMYADRILACAEKLQPLPLQKK